MNTTTSKIKAGRYCSAYWLLRLTALPEKEEGQKVQNHLSESGYFTLNPIIPDSIISELGRF